MRFYFVAAAFLVLFPIAMIVLLMDMTRKRFIGLGVALVIAAIVFGISRLGMTQNIVAWFLGRNHLLPVLCVALAGCAGAGLIWHRLWISRLDALDWPRQIDGKAFMARGLRWLRRHGWILQQTYWFGATPAAWMTSNGTPLLFVFASDHVDLGRIGRNFGREKIKFNNRTVVLMREMPADEMRVIASGLGFRLMQYKQLGDLQALLSQVAG